MEIPKHVLVGYLLSAMATSNLEFSKYDKDYFSTKSTREANDDIIKFFQIIKNEGLYDILMKGLHRDNRGNILPVSWKQLGGAIYFSRNDVMNFFDVDLNPDVGNHKEISDKLHGVAKKFGKVDLIVGEDGKLQFVKPNAPRRSGGDGSGGIDR